jgi:hypothetical protein
MTDIPGGAIILIVFAFGGFACGCLAMLFGF